MIWACAVRWRASTRAHAPFFTAPRGSVNSRQLKMKLLVAALLVAFAAVSVAQEQEYKCGKTFSFSDFTKLLLDWYFLQKHHQCGMLTTWRYCVIAYYMICHHCNNTCDAVVQPNSWRREVCTLLLRWRERASGYPWDKEVTKWHWQLHWNIPP